jgi:hypothetical protein
MWTSCNTSVASAKSFGRSSKKLRLRSIACPSAVRHRRSVIEASTLPGPMPLRLHPARSRRGLSRRPVDLQERPNAIGAAALLALVCTSRLVAASEDGPRDPQEASPNVGLFRLPATRGEAHAFAGLEGFGFLSKDNNFGMMIYLTAILRNWTGRGGRHLQRLSRQPGVAETLDLGRRDLASSFQPRSCLSNRHPLETP